MKGLVSIITPTYNSVEFIKETVHSIKQQTYTHWELILIDDGSTDATVTLIKKLAEEEPRISWEQLPQNSGPAIARNRGIKKANGDYLTFIDADDIWFPEFLKTSIHTIESTGCPFVFASYQRLDEKLQPLYPDFIVPEKVTYTDILKSNSISCLTAFVHIEKLGKKFMPEIRKRQDMGLWLQYLKEIEYALGIKQPLAIYRIRKNSLSRNKWALLKYQWDFYRKIEKLTFTQSVYYMANWFYRGLIKYKRS
ncbi:glycosyltransferase family 2 protein [Ascidiimonas sp. W6]|uniref:glycosyltransferase family 2 protein n=1 Tax=Ascidiimonas meishanensis TaxID=3128903 RepID=UPI0030EC03AD